MEKIMVRHLSILLAPVTVAAILVSPAVPAAQAQYGSETEARAMLEKAVDMFNKGESGFKDRDLYVFCANASDGVLTAHPYLKGENLTKIVGKKGFPLGKEIMQKAEEGKIKEV